MVQVDPLERDREHTLNDAILVKGWLVDSGLEDRLGAHYAMDAINRILRRSKVVSQSNPKEMEIL